MKLKKATALLLGATICAILLSCGLNSSKDNEDRPCEYSGAMEKAIDIQEQPSEVDATDSSDDKILAENEDNLEYSLYHRNNETDIRVGDFIFPQDPSYLTRGANAAIEEPFLLTASADRDYAVLGIWLENEMLGECRPFRLNLKTAELTDYGKGYKRIVPTLRKALDMYDSLYPKGSIEQSEKEITYTYFDSKTMAEEQMKCYPDLEHERLRPVSLRHNPTNGDWYYFFSIPRYGMENPKNSYEAYRDIELYCTVFDSSGNIKHTYATTLNWLIMQNISEDMLLIGEFIVWDDKLYFSYVSKWAEDFTFAENISFVEYNPYSNNIRELAVYQSSYYHGGAEELGSLLKSVKNDVLTFSLLQEKETWEQHQISVVDGKELITPVTFNLPEYPLIYVGDSLNGGYYYIVKSDKK